MNCSHLLTTQAYLDNELDVAHALVAAQHMEGCAACRALRDDLLVIRNGLRTEATYHPAPAALRAAVIRLMRGQGGAAKREPWWSRLGFTSRAFLGGAGIGALAGAACVALVLTLNPPSGGMARDVAAAHIRSLVGTHLIDVASSDSHTVKPWFAGHADVSPPADDFGGDGFSLVGGRIDYVNARRAAVTVYRHGAHIINVFAWADLGDVKPGVRQSNGYNLVSWRENDLFMCAVSDAGKDELLKLAALIQKSGHSVE